MRFGKSGDPKVLAPAFAPARKGRRGVRSIDRVAPESMRLSIVLPAIASSAFSMPKER